MLERGIYRNIGGGGLSICNQIFVYAEVVQLYERDPRPGSTKNSYMKKKILY